ncbi:MAG: protease complex subunit PrcB family protein [marine benthic group bacterium]|nr:protease complex subunit PrcB family protein [Gemmatimonadota bacterium]
MIRDLPAWEVFWADFAARVEPRPDPPSIDFSTSMVIAATMGQKTSGGFVISVEEVAKKDGTLYAKVQETAPGVMCTNIAVMTAPAVAVLVPRYEGAVAFVDTELALPCAP